MIFVNQLATVLAPVILALDHFSNAVIFITVSTYSQFLPPRIRIRLHRSVTADTSAASLNESDYSFVLQHLKYFSNRVGTMSENSIKRLLKPIFSADVGGCHSRGKRAAILFARF